MALHNTPTQCKLAAAGGRGHVGGSVPIGLLKIRIDFINEKKKQKKDKEFNENKFIPPNTSKINA